MQLTAHIDIRMNLDSTDLKSVNDFNEMVYFVAIN